MRRDLIFISLILLLVGGCATYRNDLPDRLLALPQHYDQFDAKLAWDVKAVGGSTEINGVIKNIRYYEMEDLEIRVWSLDAGGKPTHQAVDFVYSLKENETGHFTLKIPRATSGTKLRFMYRYVGNEGGSDSGGSLSWRQSFESEVP